MLNTNNILFQVINEDRDTTPVVQLRIGPFSVDVCSRPEDFQDFVQQLNENLDAIQHELDENYIT